METTKLDTSYSTENDSSSYRWNILRHKVCELVDYRIRNGNPPRWYRDACIDSREKFERVSILENVNDIDRFPNGILGEVFFMEACNNVGIECTPTYGDVDTWGADFMITNGKETRFIDVSINTSYRGLRKKNREGTFPTLFIPWHSADNGFQSYACHYLRTGEFDSNNFISDTVSYNYHNLHTLRKDVWSDGQVVDSYMDLYGIRYLESLEGSINMLRSSISH